MPAHAITHEAFDLGSRHAGDAPCFRLAILQQRMRDIVQVARTLLVRMRRAHPVAAVVEEAAREKSGLASGPDLPGDGVGGSLRPYGLEQITAENRFVLAAMHLAPIG